MDLYTNKQRVEHVLLLVCFGFENWSQAWLSVSLLCVVLVFHYLWFFFFFSFLFGLWFLFIFFFVGLVLVYWVEKEGDVGKFSFICLQFVVYLPCFNIYFDLLQMETRMPNHWPNAREKGRYPVPLVLGFHILIPSF